MKSHEVRIKELSVIKHKVQVKKVNPICLQFLNHSNLDRKFTFPKFGLTPLTIWKMSLTIIFWFFFFTIPTFGETKDSKKTELYRYNKLTLQNHPVRNPRSLPIEFVPEGSDLIYSTELKSERGYFETRESFLLFTHTFKKKQMEVYYESIFQSLYWKILQEEITENKTVMMVESQNKKVITIQIEALENGSKIKLFYKNSGS
ncbi:hypothetical protein [Leptospira interrogans]|uniref:hypothetical protein n=1 Tax=Leptospira interrogans TaxID=173 RepID=UPI0002BC6562|nr:hypothetical protein [Leptospira interrogans]AKP25845.1 hypothetical protein LIMLP_07765 [Leptospira interrogans serovar Manilae]AKP29630.1 hypothetical protein LIMHP_07760 [Leptospira interrogans serovar Manilae]EYU61628.1 hypothetical protein CI00_05190 [Leptospira interrogans serovar Manilae]